MGELDVVTVPGRVNLIGEHIDYHGFPVLPIAIGRAIRLSFRVRTDRTIRAVSAPYGTREFEASPDLSPAPPGDWENYIRAAVRVVRPEVGIDAEVESDLPAAAGLSSSTALLVAFTLALLRANRRSMSLEELMDVLPDAEQFVGTRGGGMDHAAVLASRAGCASLVSFRPMGVRHIPIPRGWSFLVAHSLVSAEKAGGARAAYNARRAAGARALAGHAETAEERDALAHVESEAQRVTDAVCAMQRSDAESFGRLLLESHASLRDRLKVSCPALDSLVEAAMKSGALGARLTGAGFGGCAVIFTTAQQAASVRRGIIEHFYRHKPEFVEQCHLLDATPADGVLAPRLLTHSRFGEPDF
jgi:galactokinase